MEVIKITISVDKIEQLINERNKLKQTITSENAEDINKQITELDKDISKMVDELNIETSSTNVKNDSIMFG